MYLESFVTFSYFSWLNDSLWLLYLSFDLVLFISIYEIDSLAEDAVDLYIMQLERKFPSSGH